MFRVISSSPTLLTAISFVVKYREAVLNLDGIPISAVIEKVRSFFEHCVTNESVAAKSLAEIKIDRSALIMRKGHILSVTVTVPNIEQKDFENRASSTEMKRWD